MTTQPLKTYGRNNDNCNDKDYSLCPAIAFIIQVSY